ncbi:MAG: hypothetical protein VX294_10840 [Candidatus Latescibacterota bacterium]|nr:hypothetical protein [Candidatus Latescibacterota bacterium]
MMSFLQKTANTQNNLLAFVVAEFKKRTLLYSLLCAIFSLCLTPSPGISRGEDPRNKDQKTVKQESLEKDIWGQAMAQDPDEWSEELKKKLLRLNPDSTIEELAEGIRTRQIHAKIREAVENGEMTREEAKQRLDRLTPPTERKNNLDKDSEIEKFRKGVLARTKMQDPGEWSDELKAAIVRAGWTVEEITEKFHGDKSKISDNNLEKEKMQKFREGVLVRAMAQSPNEWSEELQAAIKKARWNVKELAARISKRQEEERNGTRSKSTDLSSLISDLNTAVEDRSWGQIKQNVVP